MAKNKEMKDNIKKFREEAQKLENSEALQVNQKKVMFVFYIDIILVESMIHLLLFAIPVFLSKG